ncbi:SRPBCC domain-containing protein [Fulvivirga ligni]|uniref:SRPBCC domain-containing protein n=1 Tax=Fulvivirga ligni TaxID=2904246 RepID=UPI001F179BF2|nr:SRPBCC domain-containing protein [Fulvivirga ligni]UII20159.1 SRPBCC domain-containing protein [Fulvivirga ligni]
MTVGKTQSVGFQVGVRKTINCSLEELWDYVLGKGMPLWFGDSKEEPEINKELHSSTGNYGKITTLVPQSHFRMQFKFNSWTNTSAVQVRFIKAKTGTTLSFHQDKLTDERQREEMKSYWSKVLNHVSEEFL